jgi:hypothetical protein
MEYKDELTKKIKACSHKISKSLLDIQTNKKQIQYLISEY